MTEEDARLALLQTELGSIQKSIQGFDTSSFQVKGWCVTTALAIGGFSVVYRKPALLIVGMAAVLGFFLVECQIRMIQRAFIRRNAEIATALTSVGIMEVLGGSSGFDILGTGVKVRGLEEPFWQRIRGRLPDLWYAMGLVNVFSLYLLIIACLLIELIVLEA